MARKDVPPRSLVPRAAVGASTLRALGFSAAEAATLAREGRLAELAQILDLARQAFGRASAEWFLRPEPRLGNVLPATLLRDPHNGPNLVKQVLLSSVRGTIS
jgi:uncharacterized protein (DUF2384 family)